MYSLLRFLVLVLNVLSITISLRPIYALPAAQRRDVSTLDGYVDNMMLCATNFELLAQEPASSCPIECIAEVSCFVDNLRYFQSTLAELAADNDFADSTSLDSLQSDMGRIVIAQKQVVKGVEFIIEAVQKVPSDLGSTLSNVLFENARLLSGICDGAEIREIESHLTSALIQLSQHELPFLLREACRLDPEEAQAAGPCLAL
ncbi:hypothetical protein PsYK624_012810 [Phanerochaete sordida]|uniref:Uncharacterized protein n=1 Tax=Phanerochaete sordida TaxID=48140 RepID=A0A9P3FXV9_9APHY|nr:hypothetical protein PsYK624_012810 [Phanerochaete sordida]